MTVDDDVLCGVVDQEEVLTALHRFDARWSMRCRLHPATGQCRTDDGVESGAVEGGGAVPGRAVAEGVAGEGAASGRRTVGAGHERLGSLEPDLFQPVGCGRAV